MTTPLTSRTCLTCADRPSPWRRAPSRSTYSTAISEPAGATSSRSTTHGTNSDALLELRTGRAAAVLNDYPPAAYLASDPRTGTQFDLASVAQYDPGLYGIAISKDRPELRQAIRTALSRVITAGEYQAILEQWDVEDGGISATGVNAGR